MNRFVDAEERPLELQRVSEEDVRMQIERVRALRAAIATRRR